MNSRAHPAEALAFDDDFAARGFKLV